MSRVTDTVARVLANVDGETKAESHSAEETLAVYDAVADELVRRADAMRPHVEAAMRSREEARLADDGGVPVVAEPENTPATHVDRAPLTMEGSEGANDLE